MCAVQSARCLNLKPELRDGLRETNPPSKFCPPASSTGDLGSVACITTKNVLLKSSVGLEKLGKHVSGVPDFYFVSTAGF